MEAFNYIPFVISAKLAFVTTAVLFAVSFPVALLLAFRDFRGRFFIESLITLPMVLPPTVIGFYLLMLMSPKRFPGSWFSETLGVEFVFTFTGIVIASVIHTLPFMVQPLRNGLQSIPQALIESSYLLGKSRLTTLRYVILPNMKPFIASGVVLSFVHTLGEFGVVLMIGGSIPGVTKVASISVYEKVDAMQYGDANLYALVLVIFSSVSVILVNYLQRLKKRKCHA